MAGIASSWTWAGTRAGGAAGINEVIRGTKRDAERREREVRRSLDTGT